MFKSKVVLLCGLALAVGQALAADNALNTDKDKLSYSIGASVGKNLKVEGSDIDLNVLIEGLRTSFSGGKSLLSEPEIRKVMNDYQTQLRQRAIIKKQQATTDNKKKGDSFLAQFKAEKDVLSLPEGVLYKVVKAGNGPKPKDTDVVEVHYRGSLIDGTQFDATEPGRPASLKVASLISGWKQALSEMPVGSKWHIVVPPQLAYGERGVGNDIGPNEVLVFDLELIAIK